LLYVTYKLCKECNAPLNTPFNFELCVIDSLGNLDHDLGCRRVDMYSLE